MPSPPTDGAQVRRLYAAVGALLSVGALVRIWAFAIRGPLWNDEAGLALNFVGREFHTIARPYLNQQYAPYLYVMTDKLASLVLGASEYALRSPSLLAGLMLLPALALLCFQLGELSTALVGLALLFANGLAIHYSTELKPYAQDALVATALWLLALPVLRANAERRQRRRALLWLGCAGVLAPWFSLPAIFVLAAIGISLVIVAWQRRPNGPSVVQLALLGLLWPLSFAMHYLSFLQASRADAAELQTYWASMNAFAPFPPTSLDDLHWYLAKFFYLFNLFVAQDAAGLRYMVAAFWLFGVYALWQRDRALCALTTLPFLLLMAAAAARVYIVCDRTLLFMAPFVIAPVALGLDRFAKLRAPHTRIAVGVFTLLVCVTPVLGVAHELHETHPTSDVRRLVDHLKRNVRAGDRVYVETQVDWIYAYYARRAAFDVPYVKANSRMDNYDPAAALEVLDTLKPAPRVWALVPTLGANTFPDPGAVDEIQRAERVVTEHLNQLGRQVQTVDGGNVRLYLYDLAAAAAIDPG